MSVWSLAYDTYEPRKEGLREALCTVGNGFFAVRGSAPECAADDVHYPGTYVAGYYNSLVSDVAGRRVENESMVNMPNWLPLTFRVGDEPWFHIDRVLILDFAQELDLRMGVLKRQVRFQDEAGRTTLLAQRRFVHMGHRHLGALVTTVVPEDWAGEIWIRSAIDGRVRNGGVERYRKLAGHHLLPVESGQDEESPDIIYLQMETNQSHVRVAEAVRTRAHCDGNELKLERSLVAEEAYVAHELALRVEMGIAYTFEKVAALFGGRDHAISEPCSEARAHARRAGDFEELLTSHVLTWSHLWDRFAVTMEGPSQRSSMALNLHIFHLLQTVSPSSIDLDVGVPARGLHGEAYRGHIFWDELFIFPFLNFRLPELTRALLKYRYRRLPEARWRAQERGCRGALYPWQSGSNGEEEGPTWHLNPRSDEWILDNSHLQTHINIAVAYNIWSYYEVTANVSFMAFQGAEMLLEIARYYASKATYNKIEDRYEILGVMGPDEYHDAYPGAGEPGLNNNAYTNVMAVWCLLRAMEVMHLLPPRSREELRDRLALKREEFDLWEDVSRKMKIPFHDGVISQFQGYEDLEELDWEGYRTRYGDIQRLDRILGAENDTPNRYKASKQADVLMLFYLLSAEELQELFERLGYTWSSHTIPKNIDYYIARTSHGSTLSRVVHSWVLARHDRERSWRFFSQALESDLADIQKGTTSEGVHLGAMAGTVDLIQRCYMGLETRSDTLWLNPLLPAEISRVKLDLSYRALSLHVELTTTELLIRSHHEDTGVCTVGVRSEEHTLNPGETLRLPVA